MLILSFLPREVWYGEWRAVRIPKGPGDRVNLSMEYKCRVEVLEGAELWIWPKEPWYSYMLQEPQEGLEAFQYWNVYGRRWGWSWRMPGRRPDAYRKEWIAPKEHVPIFTWQRVRRHQLWALGLVQKETLPGSW